MNALNEICIVIALCGIDSAFMIVDRTLHNKFKLPIPILESSVANVSTNNVHGLYLNSTSIIIIDEIYICPIDVFKIINLLYRDFTTDNDS